jgi:hypothetical protein
MDYTHLLKLERFAPARPGPVLAARRAGGEGG